MKIKCAACDYVGEAAVLQKGSRSKEIALWCCLFLPGLLYTLWRLSSDGRYMGCPRCKSAQFRPITRREWKDLERQGALKV
ncbi:MAG: hypothetical protein ACUVWY_05000 [Desulfosoma sp.]|uniref:hypothetical protein n=1 Tax=Desulfosoma sp. TaxID=2603217 RepID=UPI00404B45F4